MNNNNNNNDNDIQVALAEPEPAAPLLVTAERRMTDEQLHATLVSRITRATTEGKHVESRGDYQATVVSGKRPNHKFHLVMTVVTASAWFWLVWLWVIIFGGEKRWLITVDEYGTVQRRRV